MENPDEDIRQKFVPNFEMKNGRSEIGLPWKEEVNLANKKVARKRLQETTRTLL